MKTRRVALFAAQAAVSASLLIWLSRGLDVRGLGHLLLATPLTFGLASLGVIVAGQVLYAWRWWLLLSASEVGVSLGAAIRSYFIGIFANNFLPSTVGGDATKVYYLGRQHGYRTIVASVVVDRMLGLGSLAVLAAAASWLVPPVSGRFVMLRLVVTAIAAASVGLIGLGMLGTGDGQDVPRDASVRGKLRRLHRDMAGLLRRPRILAYGAGIVFTYFLALSLVYLWFMDVSGVTRPSLVAVFTAVTMTGVLSNVPISLNGLGLREQLHALLFAPLGVPKEAAVAISLLLFGHILLTSVAGMVLWLMQPARVSSAAVPLAAEAAEENA